MTNQGLKINAESLREKGIGGFCLTWFIDNFSEDAYVDYQEVLDKALADERFKYIGSILFNFGKSDETLELAILEGEDFCYAGSLIVNGPITMNGMLFVGGSLHSLSSIEVSWNMEVGEHIKVAGNLEAGQSIKAGGNIDSGGSILAGRGIVSKGSIYAHDEIRSGEEIYATKSIIAGDKIVAGSSINAGETIEAGSGIMAGVNIKNADWARYATVIAREKPKNLTGGCWDDNLQKAHSMIDDLLL